MGPWDVVAVVAVAGCNRRDPAALSRPTVSRNAPGSKVGWIVGLTGRGDLVIDGERSPLSPAAPLLVAGHVLRPPLTPMICPVM